MQHLRTTMMSLVALALFAPGCSMLSSFSAAVPGGQVMTQGLTAGFGQLMAKRQECRTKKDAAAMAALNPTATTPTMGGAGNVQAAVGAATAVISNDMCSRADRRKAKREAKRAAKRGEPLPTQQVAPTPEPVVAPSEPTDIDSGIVDPYAEPAVDPYAETTVDG